MKEGQECSTETVRSHYAPRAACSTFRFPLPKHSIPCSRSKWYNHLLLVHLLEPLLSRLLGLVRHVGILQGAAPHSSASAYTTPPQCANAQGRQQVKLTPRDPLPRCWGSYPPNPTPWELHHDIY